MCKRILSRLLNPRRGAKQSADPHAVTAVPLEWGDAQNLLRVRIEPSVLREVWQLAVTHLPKEVGTVLMGSYLENGRAAAYH